MDNILKLIILIVGISLCIWVITLLARKKINERNTIVWAGGVIIILILSTNPKLLDVVSRRVGISYPPSLLFFAAFIILFIVNLYQSIQISQLHAKIKEISQVIALNTVQSSQSVQNNDKSNTE